MSERQQIRDYLACANHADRRVGHVCGECGDPVCDDCSSSVTDLTLDHYEVASGLRVVGWILCIVAGLFLVDLLPREIWLTLSDLAGKPMYIPGGLEKALIIFGVGLLGTMWIGNRTSGGRWVFIRQRNQRTVCDDCYDSKRLQRTIVLAFSALGLVVILYGIYSSINGLDFRSFWIAGLGGALWVLRYEFATALVAVIE